MVYVTATYRRESVMTDRALGVGAKTCDDKKCEVCGEVRETKSKAKAKEDTK